jgi:hypothetical protein
MSLRVIGVGFGRTGTLSLKLALEALGVGPCYHMMELAERRAHADSWIRAARGEPLDCQGIFADFAAALDWPATAFWREIVAAYPDARVILTVRDEASWYASFRDTILDKSQGLAPPKALPLRAIYDVTREVIIERTFGGRAADMRHAIDVFRNHNAEIVAEIPPERLLVYDLAGGWEPLCRFLDLPVPTSPFPHVNTRSAFQSHYGDLRAQASAVSRYPTGSKQ